MPFIKSIASRIFGLAVILVCLMIALAGFLLWQVTVLQGELLRISIHYTPLVECLDELNEAGLRRRIAFERWYGALNTPVDRSKAIQEASSNYGKFTDIVRLKIKEALTRIDQIPDLAESHPAFERIRAKLDHIAATYQITDARKAEVLQLVQQGETRRAADILSVTDDLQASIQTDRSDVQQTMDKILASATHAASKRHAEVVWTTIVASLVAVLLGLTMAAIVTRRLVKPVRNLMLGIQNVERGDLTVELPVGSADEIGALTRSFNYFVGELRLKEDLRNTFGKYIDPRILNTILLDPASAEAAGTRQDMSVSFADLVGFTEIGEHLTPAGVVNLLNRHFTFQAEAIQHRHGVVDKFMGDAVMAFWGPPFTNEKDSALLACRGALEQSRAIARLQAMLPEITGLRKNLPQLDVRVGISSGEVIVGNIGSENTRSYTVIGDAVNLASRLEQANRFYGTRILLCEATRLQAGEAIIAREIDTIVVKGKSETTRIYELLGLADDTLPDVKTLCELSASALTAYRARDWDTAEGHWKQCLTIDPADRPARLFLDRIADFRRVPPGEDWNGVWVFDVK